MKQMLTFVREPQTPHDLFSAAEEPGGAACGRELDSLSVPHD